MDFVVSIYKLITKIQILKRVFIATVTLHSLASLVSLVYLVSLASLVSLVYLVSLVV